jgi:hypothetical protein
MARMRGRVGQVSGRAADCGGDAWGRLTLLGPVGYTLIDVPYTLTQFALTGRLGALQLGMLQSEVRKLLGDPDDVSLTRQQIWKYGQLEITFTLNLVRDSATLNRERAVEMIIVEFWQTNHELPSRLGVTADLTNESAFVHVATALSERQAVLETIPSLTFDNQVAVRVQQSGVTFTFAPDRLHSISLSS